MADENFVDTEKGSHLFGGFPFRELRTGEIYVDLRDRGTTFRWT